MTNDDRGMRGMAGMKRSLFVHWILPILAVGAACLIYQHVH